MLSNKCRKAIDDFTLNSAEITSEEREEILDKLNTTREEVANFVMLELIGTKDEEEAINCLCKWLGV